MLGGQVDREPNPGDSTDFAGQMALVRFGSIGLDLFEHGANQREMFTPTRTGLDHVAFSTSSIDELERWAARLDAMAVSRSPIRNADGVVTMFDFCDPDGIQLEIVFLDLERLRVARAR